MAIHCSHPPFGDNEPDAPIWRFMNLEKLLALLTKSKMAFPQVAKLAQRDPKEGAYTNADKQISLNLETDDDLLLKIVESTYGPLDASQFEKEKDGFRKLLDIEKLESTVRVSRERHYVNCWTVGDYEPAQLWSVFASENSGVAIKSTFERMKASFERTEKLIYYGRVKYLDYDTETISRKGNNVAIYVRRKRREFSHENEFRFYTFNEPSNFQTLGYGANPDLLMVDCYLEPMIEKVIVAPFAPSWYFDVVTDVVAKFGIDAPVVRSALL